MQRTDRARQAGFSLVELAIVLVIIGLIVGGVLKGQDLIQSARVNDIQSTMNEIRTASSTFQNKYNGFPGDFDQATQFVDGNAENGGGNGRVDNGDRVNASCTGGTSSSAGETCLFWQHLNLAGLLGGVGDLTTGSYSLDKALGASVGGIYSISYGNGTSGFPGSGGATTHWILLGDAASGDSVNDTPVLTPVDLRSVDAKSDDGQPNSGDIRASTTNACADGTDASLYASGDSELCAAFLAL